MISKISLPFITHRFDFWLHHSPAFSNDFFKDSNARMISLFNIQKQNKNKQISIFKYFQKLRLKCRSDFNIEM